jgi:hypothetical protein
MEHTSTMRKKVKEALKKETFQSLQFQCRLVLKELRQFPKQNKNQIRYYEKYWMLLSEI